MSREPLPEPSELETGHKVGVRVAEHIAAVGGLQQVLHEPPPLDVVRLLEVVEPVQDLAVRPYVHLRLKVCHYAPATLVLYSCSVLFS